ncbi:ribose-phosphate diphosphokinase [Nanoarchaeota archaeon]
MEESVILADPNSKAWPFAKKVFEIISRYEPNFSLKEVEITHFRDGESFVHVKKNVRGQRCYFIHDSSKRPNDWIVELMLVNDALKRASVRTVHDILPYMRYSRQDRKLESRVPISARVIADSIGYRADRVMTTDLHADQIQGFYNKPFDNLYAFPTIVEYLKSKHPEILNNCVVVSPDAGGVIRARAFAKRLNTHIAIIDKRREKPGEIAEMRVIGDIKDKNAIIVDDIIDSGGTLMEATKALKKMGALKVYACCTHAILTNNAIEKLPKVIDKMIVTDSIPHEDWDGIEVVSLAPLYAEAIRRTDKGQSISALYA